MREAQAAGYVRFIGASTYGEDAPLAVLEDGRFDTLQVAYSPIDRTLEARVLPLARQKDIGIVARSVLLRGALTHRYTLIPPALAELKAAIGRLDALVGVEAGSLPEMAYRYVLDHAAVSTALVGTARVAELEAALAFADKRRLPPALVVAIREINVSDRSQLIPSNWPADFSA
jgi:aryl-alcohol dehydrogenase-like predicted oxidoreductase